MDLAPLNKRIERRFAELSPRLRVAARYVLDRPDEVALHSMRALALRAGVKPSIMLRLARELGFAGYDAFRAPFREWLRQRQVSFTARARALRDRARHSEEAALVSNMLAADLADLEETYTSLGEERLVAARKMLAAAPRVFVLGTRSLYPVAFAFHYACRMFMDTTILLTGQGGTFADELRRVQKGDVMLAIGLDPLPSDMLHAVGYARAAGARLLALTDSPISPLAQGAALVLPVKAGGPSFFDSAVPALSIVQTLVALLLAEGGEEVIGRLARSERQLVGFDVYPKPATKRPRLRRVK
jgi:DNA-binding MurR/RpiR family transcriptional regulator